METSLAMHRRALEFFGGIPKRCLYDNLKSVVLHHVGATVHFNPRFLAFAGHYLFEPTAAPVRYPEAKGRVESSIRYLRQSFFYGRTFSSLADLREQAARWRDETANLRVHATTRERPADRLLVERTRLRALPERAFDTDLVVPGIVSKEARIRLDSNTYSVPPEVVGKTVHVCADDDSVRVILDGAEVARHARCWDRRRHVEDPRHVEKLLERRKGALGPRRKDRIAALSDECRVYLQEVARRRIDLENEVRKLGRLLAQHGEPDFIEGVSRALAARTFGARYVRTLIDQARFAHGLSNPRSRSSPATPWPTASRSPRTSWRTPLACLPAYMMPSSTTPPRSPTPISSDLAALSLEEVLRALGLDHAAELLGPATQKAIARNDLPTALLDRLMREQLRVDTRAAPPPR